MAEPRKQLHVAMFPWLAFGHMLPYLELANFMAKRGHKISFLSTPRNIQRLPNPPRDLATLIKFVPLPLPPVDGLPDEAEATTDLQPHQVPYLKAAYDGLEESMAQLLEASSLDWIIYDFAPHWLPRVASRLGISRACFSIFNAWTISFLGQSSSAMIEGTDPRTEREHFTVPPPWIPFPSKVAFRLHEVRRYMGDHVSVNSSGLSDIARFGYAIAGSDVVAIRSCSEMEGDFLRLVGELHGKPTFPVGLLPPSVSGGDAPLENSWLTIREWLDKQSKGSVVYIAFGSENTLSQAELTELAMGLELSGVPFFWVLLRKQHKLAELPAGFEERVKGRGVVWTSWAPQLRVLAHDSVGGFLTHNGWSSIIEGLYFGRVLLMLPFSIDQGLNARVLGEQKVGVEVPKEDEDGSFTRDSVAKSLKLVLVDEEGAVFRGKAKQMSKLVGDRDLQHQYVDKFIEFLISQRLSVQNLNNIRL
ncbi:hypothetical protein Tsubulata_041396 [Turnera subulata]|uniref:Glycosyltransferase n=1 Tax=Turnera subulata TaxID=218843 RepID=A0A9Q0JLQ7_9ROSI|nr:hypothetical protein Tsubulata_041396 [Turnera subulata]